MEGLGRLGGGLDQAEEQGQLQGVVAARGNHLRAEGVGQQAGEPPGRAGRGLQQSLEVTAHRVGVWGDGVRRRGDTRSV